MINLASTTDALLVTTNSAGTIAVHSSWIDLGVSTATPGRTNIGPITTATTSTVVSSPAASTTRGVNYISVTNADAAVVNQITVNHTDGTNTLQLISATLQPGQTLRYQEGIGWVTLPI